MKLSCNQYQLQQYQCMMNNVLQIKRKYATHQNQESQKHNKPKDTHCAIMLYMGRWFEQTTNVFLIFW